MEPDLLASLRQARDDIYAVGFRPALVGGFAVGLHTRPRMTKDVDLAVAVHGDEQAEDLMRGLHHRGYRVVQLLENAPMGRLATLRLSPPHSESASATLDLLFASCGIEAEIVSQAVELDLLGVGRIEVARVGHLVAMKVLSVRAERPNDLADLRSLIRAASDAELAVAREAVRWIEERGYHRGRNLAADLERLVVLHDPRPSHDQG